MKVVSARRFGLWTKLFQRWLKKQLDEVVASKATTADVTAVKQAILDALSHISPTDPNSLALAQFFGVTLLEGYEFMTDTEVCDELEDIMQHVDLDLTAEQAAAITAQTLNPSES